MEGENGLAMICCPNDECTSEKTTEAKEKATAFLRDRGYTVLYSTSSSMWVNKPGIKNDALFAAALRLESMALCKAVYFCDGWQKTRACRIENAAAKSFGLKCYYEIPGES